jgi:hypothetical protein
LKDKRRAKEVVMSTAKNERTHGTTRKMVSVANDLNEPIEFEYEIHKPPLMSRQRKARKRNPRRVARKA